MATIKGTSDTDNILGLQGDDIILAGRGNDSIDGGGGNDRIFADYGDDLINGGEGDDSLFGEHGNDIVNGGAGSDRVSGGRGDDLGIYRLADNQGSADYYDGGEGSDTLRLILTHEQASSGPILAEIEAFRQFLKQNQRPDGADNPTFHFSTFGLAARNWENVEVVVEPPAQLPVVAISDATVTEGDPGGTNATIEFTVRRTGDNGTASTVIYTATPGTAT
ncbi:MAG: hypothetical protein KBE22_09375, partial [Candidatus Accumulibacter sp.]|nr:hypothetical protein [Accumulibacter sp.]